MKYLFLLFCSFSLLACNSGNNKETNSDEKNATQTNGGKPWSNEDQVNFMNDCIEEAGRNISRDSAQKYCACVLT
ncbi:MAG: hypothetical protein H0U44_10840 [Flavisolibacter sp.]|nr:hypothetical protein [Flavisolibacter sp.]